MSIDTVREALELMKGYTDEADAIADNAIAELAALTAERDAWKAKAERCDSTCVWSRIESECNDWDTSCEMYWAMINDETPVKNGMNYCPKCGKRIALQEDTP